jgi:coenzyme F420-reducing hydrogenase beta subunit
VATQYDIGIFGLWYGRNYGSMLTYYALHSILKDAGLSPVMVFNPLGNPDIALDALPKSHPRRLAAEFYEVTQHYKLAEMSKLNDICDSFILGSDQLWNYGLSKAYRQSYFLDFAADDKRKIAYGVSFGSKTYNGPAEEKPVVKANLERFSAISVRDDYSLSIAKEEFGISAAEKVVDPVFAVNPLHYETLIQGAELDISGQFIFAYVLDPNPEIGLALHDLALKRGAKVYVVLDEPESRFEKNSEALNLGDVRDVEILKNVSIKEFLWLTKNAVAVFTDSFHGCCFSIIFRKQFVALRNKFRASFRFNQLLQPLGLIDRLVLSPSDMSDSFGSEKNIEYNAIFDALKSGTDFSRKWLQEALFSSEQAFAPQEKRSPAKQEMVPVSMPDAGFQTDDALRLDPYYGKTSYENKAKEPYYICEKSKCTGCGACTNICPFQIVEMREDNEGFRYPFLADAEKCTQCDRCKRVCPVLYPTERIKLNIQPLEVYAAFSLDADTRYMSTSGGAFTEIAKYALKMSGVCYGAAYTDNLDVQHIRIAREEDLFRIRQSKYYQSVIGDTYKSIKADLEQNLYVVFCGAPCQCAGLAKYLGKDYRKLVIVDFICHSICSPKAFKAYLKELQNGFHAEASRVWFKNKETTWQNFSLRIDFKNKQNYYREVKAKDSFFVGFLKYRAFLRPSCHECSFKEFRRAADITLADFWGLKWENPNLTDKDKNHGVSVVMTNTDKGKYIFDTFAKHNMYVEKHTIQEVAPANGGLNHSNRCGLYRDFFFEQVEKVPFSKIIDAMEDRERELKRQRAAQNASQGR